MARAADNAVLRGTPGKVAFLQKTMEDLCNGNKYTTTLHVINSCIVKLGKLMPAQKVYRGIAGGLLPDNFWKRNEFNVRGGVEFAFMSTTTNKEVAMEYAGASGKQGIVFEIQMGMLDRGADLEWISQARDRARYPLPPPRRAPHPALLRPRCAVPARA